MRNRPRRGILSRIADAIGRIISGGPGPEPGPSLRPSAEEEYEQEQFQPLPTTEAPREPQEEIIYEETTITPAPVLGNTEYIPSYYTTNRAGGRSAVYGRYRVTDPMPGDVEDLMNTQGGDEITVTIVGTMETYAGYAAHGKQAASFKFSVSELQYIMDQNRGDSTFTTEALINDYLAKTGNEWIEIREMNIINKQDRPQ